MTYYRFRTSLSVLQFAKTSKSAREPRDPHAASEIWFETCNLHKKASAKKRPKLCADFFEVDATAQGGPRCQTHELVAYLPRTLVRLDADY